MDKRGWKIVSLVLFVLLVVSFGLVMYQANNIFYLGEESRFYWCESVCLLNDYDYSLYEDKGCFCTGEEMFPEIHRIYMDEIYNNTGLVDYDINDFKL